MLCSRYLLNTPSQQNDTQIAGKMTLCQLMFQSFLLFQVNRAVNDLSVGFRQKQIVVYQIAYLIL